MPEDLEHLGGMAFGGESVHPPGLRGIPLAELGRPALDFHTTAGAASSIPAANRDFLEELRAAADLGGGWAHVGALCIGWNAVAATHREEPAYLEVVDLALEVLRTDGVAYASAPPFAMERWTSLHGYDGVAPAGWPSPLTEIPVVSPEEAPPVEDLAPGERRRLAQAPAAPTNMICAERRDDDSIQAVIEGAAPDTGGFRYWDWQGLDAPDYQSLLRELGGRLVTHTFWAHEDLIPYFPCRTRSRDQLRIEARAWRG